MTILNQILIKKINDDLDDSKSKMLQNIKNLYNKAIDAQKKW